MKTKEQGKAPALARTSSETLDVIQEIEDLGAELSSLLEPKPIMDALATRMVDRFGLAVAGVWTVDKTETHMELGATAGTIALPESLTKPPVSNPLFGRAVSDRQTQILDINDPAQEDLAAWAKSHGMRFVAVYPLLHAAHVEGVMMIAGAERPPEDRGRTSS